ncbi:LPS export ABC transporter periplasmic protein LptC [Leptolyngbya subtilissima ST-M1]|uniref:LPS export ABC transporter periplasmic protein LptC n=1 Tax=Cyanophyceae TaxID=3028117 RepID=UPI001F54FEE3|nr:LPS export ABC transporter periplasmic protein LptC [Nodosilinea sp. FACHB-131]
MARWRRLMIGGAAIAALAVGLYSLIGPGFGPKPSAEGPAAEDPAPGLTLRDVTLEQPDEQGQLLWRVKGKEVTYSPDQQVAFITRPDGDLFQDGDVIYQVVADTGEVRENGSVILLRGNIVATGVKNGSVLRGNEMEWRPQDDVLVMRDQITGTHPQLRAVADEARVFNRENRMELAGNVVASTVADSKTEPWLKLQAQELAWFWEEERIDSAQPLRVEQFKQNAITDVVVGQRGTVNLATQLVNLRGQVAMQMLDIPLNMASEALDWQVAEEQVTVNQPLTLIHPENKIRVTARQGRMDLAAQQIFLSQDVVAVGEANQARMTSDRLNWNVDTQTLVAEGGVNYRQANPNVNLNGARAVGRLDNQTVVVDGGRVVTEIVPN